MAAMSPLVNDVSGLTNTQIHYKTNRFHVYGFYFWFCSVDDVHLSHGHNIYYAIVFLSFGGALCHMTLLEGFRTHLLRNESMVMESLKYESDWGKKQKYEVLKKKHQPKLLEELQKVKQYEAWKKHQDKMLEEQQAREQGTMNKKIETPVAEKPKKDSQPKNWTEILLTVGIDAVEIAKNYHDLRFWLKKMGLGDDKWKNAHRFPDNNFE